MSNLEEEYKKRLFENGFLEEMTNMSYNASGKLYTIPKNIGQGVYWIYSQENLYDIKIHDFYLYEDSLFQFSIQQNNLSICYYAAISGKELSPYKDLSDGYIKSFIGGKHPCQTLIYKNTPVKAIEIEITPAYYEKYLKSAYPDEYNSLYQSFCKISLTKDFLDMVYLFHQILNYHGEGMAAKLFYDSKVAEAISLIIDYQKRQANKTKNISYQDQQLLEAVITYIKNHFQKSITIDELCCIACMGRTKLKTLFKQKYDCTITQYIQQCRLNQAQILLTSTNLTIQDIALQVGYSNASRFAKIWKQNTGLFPNEYRKILQNK